MARTPDRPDPDDDPAVVVLQRRPGRVIERRPGPDGRPVIVKRFAPEARADWLRETAAAFGLPPHARIVRCLDTACGPDGEGRLVYEFVPGGPVRPPLPPDALRACLEAVLGGLAHLHGHGWVHCDVKPDNVYVWPGDPPRYVLGDLGAAAPVREARQRPHAIGSPAYMAPERDYDRFDPRSDLYSVGVLAFELATGTRPFDGDARAVRRAHLDRAPPLERVSDPALRAWIGTLLAKRPEARFADADAARRALVGQARVSAAGDGPRPADARSPGAVVLRASATLDGEPVRLRVSTIDDGPRVVIDDGERLRWFDPDRGRVVGPPLPGGGVALAVVDGGGMVWSHRGRIETCDGPGRPPLTRAAGLEGVMAVDRLGDALAWAGHRRGGWTIGDAPARPFPVETFGFVPRLALVEDGVVVSGGRLNDRLRCLREGQPPRTHALPGTVRALGRIGPATVAGLTAALDGAGGHHLVVVDADGLRARTIAPPRRIAADGISWMDASGWWWVDPRGEPHAVPWPDATPSAFAVSPDRRFVVGVWPSAGGVRLSTWETR